MDRLFTYIDRRGRAIGSRVWGGATKESDWDFAIKYTKWESLQKMLLKKGIVPQNLYGISEERGDNLTAPLRNNGNYKFYLGSKQINIIVYTDEYWKYASAVFDAMEALCEVKFGERFRYKVNRIRVMEMLFSLYAKPNNKNR